MHRSQFGDAFAMARDEKALPALHFTQQFRKARLGFERADLFSFHANKYGQSGQNCQQMRKEARRRQLARLPFPLKVKAVVQLQRMAAPLLRQRGRRVRVWELAD